MSWRVRVLDGGRRSDKLDEPGKLMDGAVHALRLTKAAHI
jgi:hypothetical protein